MCLMKQRSEYSVSSRFKMPALVLLPILLLSAICQADLISEVSLQGGCVGEIDYRLPTTVTPSNYELHLEPDVEAFQFKGQARITIDVNKDVTCITLNAQNLTINKADVTLTLPKGEKRVHPINIKKVKEEFMIFTFNDILKKGNGYTLDISYSGLLNNETSGFFRSEYLLPNGTKVHIAATHFEPTLARQAFPCWDEPAFKATFKISITHLSNYTAVSNMPQDGDVKKINGSNKVTTCFKTSPKMSTYLVAFVVSNYNKTENRDKTIRIWTKPHAVNQTWYALQMAERVIKKMEEFTNIKYNTYMPKLDSISVRNFEDSGMENWGLAIFGEAALLYEPNVTPARGKQVIGRLLMHELSHQWFGNLVSLKWWKYLWLKEGFATYFEYHMLDQLEPDWRIAEAFVTNNLQENAFVVDAEKSIRPINRDVSSTTEIWDEFDSIAYNKAASIIRMMSHILTLETFQKGLQHYLNKLRLSVADDNDLFQSLQTVADKTWEGKGLKEIMDSWINNPGYPLVNVVKNGEELQISQERFILYGNSDDTTWWVPITYVQQCHPKFTNATPAAWLKPEDTETIIPNVDKKGWVIVNVNQTGYYRVNYDEDNWNRLTEYLKSNNYAKISPLNRAQLIDDALTLAQAGRLSYSVALSLASYLTQETDYIPWNSAFRHVNFLERMLHRSECYPLFQLYVRYLMKQVTRDVKYESTAKDNHATKLLRANVLKWGCKAQEQECMKYAQREFNAWVNDPSKHPLDIDQKEEIICAGLRTADEQKWNKTWEILMNSTYDQIELNKLLPFLGCSGSLSILRKFLVSSLEPNSTLDFNIAVEAVVSDHKEGVDLALDVLAENQEKIEELDNAEEKIKKCIETLGGVVTDEKQFIKLLKLSVKLEGDSDLVSSIVQKGTQAIEWKDTYMENVKKWLTTHRQSFRNRLLH